MIKLASCYRLDQDGETVIITPLMELGELNWQRFAMLTDDLVDDLKSRSAKDLVVDLSYTNIIGSDAIGFLLRLHDIVAERSGRMALCGVSEHERRVLELMHLNHRFWHICSKRCKPSPPLCSGCPEFVASCLCDS